MLCRLRWHHTLCVDTDAATRRRAAKMREVHHLAWEVLAEMKLATDEFGALCRSVAAMRAEASSEW